MIGTVVGRAVVAFGVAALATVLGILLVLMGWAMSDPGGHTPAE